jgi:flagellar hook-associated protein 3 FlgL
MRLNPNMTPYMLSAIQRVQQEQADALQQIATGKRVNVPSDDPAAAAALVENHNRSDLVDQYTQNGNTLLGIMQTADSVLSTVVGEVSQAVSVGVEGANGTLSDANREILAQQVQGILDSVVSQANTAYRGMYLFAGTASTTVPFTASTTAPSGYQYDGNDNVNSVAIGDGYQVQVNLPGDQLFQQPGADLLGSLQQMVTALRVGDSATIETATNQLRTALDHITQERAFYGTVTNQINDQETYLQNESVNIKSEENTLVGVDLASAATRLSQAQTAMQATLAATARVLPQTLLDYLQ